MACHPGRVCERPHGDYIRAIKARRTPPSPSSGDKPELCRVMGLPGKPNGISGADVERYYREGRIREIAEYCESDVLNPYRVVAKRGVSEAPRLRSSPPRPESGSSIRSQIAAQRQLARWPGQRRCSRSRMSPMGMCGAQAEHE